MMADFIDREKIRNEVCDGCTHRTPDNGCGWPEPCNRLIAGFVSAPAADVVPVVHGTPMLRYRRHVFVEEKSYAMYCPSCGKRLCSRFKNFCPNCGAKMDGGQHETD